MSGGILEIPAAITAMLEAAAVPAAASAATTAGTAVAGAGAAELTAAELSKLAMEEMLASQAGGLLAPAVESSAAIPGLMGAPVTDLSTKAGFMDQMRNGLMSGGGGKGMQEMMMMQQGMGMMQPPQQPGMPPPRPPMGQQQGPLPLPYGPNGNSMGLPGLQQMTEEEKRKRMMRMRGLL